MVTGESARGVSPEEQDAAAAVPRPVAVRWRPFRLPLRHRFEAAHGALGERVGVVIQLVTADGAVGLGEASPLPALGGGSATDVVALLEAHALSLLGEGAQPDLGPWQPGVGALRCALDVAWLDLVGQRQHQPIARLLVAEPASEVPVNAVIGAGSPDEVARFGREAMAAGYSVLKLKCGTQSVDDDLERIAALRTACPAAELRVDVNGAWDERTVAGLLPRLAEQRVDLLEQPLPAAATAAMARVRAMTPFPVAADESLAVPGGLAAVLSEQAADLLVLKPMVLGGLRMSLALARHAAGSGVASIATTTFDSSIGTAAALHLAAALPGLQFAHGLSTGEHLAADLVTAPLLPSSGAMRVPERPGLGVVLDEAALEAVATGPWREASRSL